MSDPYTTLQKFIVLKFMEKNSVPSSKAVQQEIIDNALATAEALKKIQGMNDMFNFNKPQQPQQFANPQQPNINLGYQMPPVTSTPLDNMTMGDLDPNTAKQQQQQAYNDMTQQHNRISAYNQSVMEINRMLMGMQQEFFQNVQKIQQQLQEIMKSIYS